MEAVDRVADDTRPLNVSSDPCALWSRRFSCKVTVRVLTMLTWAELCEIFLMR